MAMYSRKKYDALEFAVRKRIDELPLNYTNDCLQQYGLETYGDPWSLSLCQPMMRPQSTIRVPDAISS